MKILIKLAAYLSIVALILPSILYLSNKMELDRVKAIMLVATVVWFGLSTILAWNLDEKLMGNSHDIT